MRSAIQDEFDVHGQEFAVAVYSGAMAGTRRMTLRCSRHIFSAIVDHLYRFSGLSCEERSVTGNHRRVFFLPSEGSTGFCLNYPYLLCWKVQERHQRLVNVIRTLH